VEPFFGWLVAGIIWEQKFEINMSAQFTGLVIGVPLVFLDRERLAKMISGNRGTAASLKSGENRSS
jgi:hypothetical protein